MTIEEYAATLFPYMPMEEILSKEHARVIIKHNRECALMRTTYIEGYKKCMEKAIDWMVSPLRVQKNNVPSGWFIESFKEEIEKL